MHTMTRVISACQQLLHLMLHQVYSQEFMRHYFAQLQPQASHVAAIKDVLHILN